MGHCAKARAHRRGTAVTGVDAICWRELEAGLDDRGYAVTPPLLAPDTCAALAALFDDDRLFRSTVEMARHGFGRGQYRYFAVPPGPVAGLRNALYPKLAGIANRWAAMLGISGDWPAQHAELLARCHAAGQRRSTPLLLRYGPGDYNCLHQDLYGPIHFPLQAVVMLDRPGVDFDGGELVLVEKRPRMQSRAEVIRLEQGCAAIFPVRERPRQGRRGVHRTEVRHAVASVGGGRRRTLGLIFHDAA
jgi:hypothetical protein